ncbi:hypothetical protein G9A89_014910 [Geosiphon pyriformis]|nr:hypothetical protein G9A89_014910 [Geosiphon pyriformis]
MDIAWDSYFENDTLSDWSIQDFHERWIERYEDDPKKLRYRKANDSLNKSLQSLLKCHDDAKKTKALDLLMDKASTFL